MVRLMSPLTRRLILTAAIFVCSRFSAAQATSGSIVIFNLQEGKFSVAADSETTPSDRPGSKGFAQCKIVALGHGTLFAAAGFMDYTQIGQKDTMRSWSTFDVARQALKSTPTRDIGSIADEWANQMKTKLETIGTRHFSALAFHGEAIANGVFATAKDGSIFVAIRNLKLVNGAFQIESQDCPDGALGAAGELAVFRELTEETHAGALTRQRSKLAGPDAPTSGDPTALVTLVAKLTARWDPSGFVGGPIDVAELWSDGSHVTGFLENRIA